MIYVTWCDSNFTASEEEIGHRKMAIDLEAIRKRMQELSGANKNSSIQMWKPEAGEYKVRGLPNKYATEGMPLIERWFYFIGETRGFLAPKQFNKPDPVNEFIRSLYKSGKAEDREIAKKLQPKMYAYMPIVVRGQEDKGVQIWKFSKNVYQRLLSFFTEADEDGTVYDILDPNAGFDLKVVVSPSAKKVEGRSYLDFTIDVNWRKATKLHPDPEVMKKWLDSVPNVDDMNKQKSSQEIETILNNWLNGDQTATASDGTLRGPATTDDLDKLAEELKSDAAKKTPLDEEEEEPKPSTKRASKKSSVSTEDPLEKAFQELEGDAE